MFSLGEWMALDSRPKPMRRLFTPSSFSEGGDDWNAAADAHGQWSFAEYLFEAAFGCFVCGEVDGADVAVAAVEHFYFYFDGVWCYFVEVIDDELSDFLVVLMWDEA